MKRKLRVGVVFGGRNSEHEVSLKSARAAMEALDRSKYDVVPIGIDKAGRWLVGDDPLLALERAADPALLGREAQAGVVQRDEPLRISDGRLPGDTIALDGAPAAGEPTDIPGRSGEPTAKSVRTPALVPAAAAETAQLPGASPSLVLPEHEAGGLDVILPVLHGMYGEDGALQGLLDIADVAYVGCGVLAAAVGMDKGVMKAAFSAAGLPQVPYVLLRRAVWEREREAVLHGIERQLRYSMFTKPANAGSSVGVSKCTNRDELARGIELAARHDRRLIVEQGIDRARELEVAVLGNDEPEASLIGEIEPGNDWYDYADKYLDGRTAYLIPAPIDEALAEQVRRMAIDAFKAIDGAGLARVDFLMDRAGGEVFINEINTFPGFTQNSMYPKMWEASGLSYGAMLDRLIELAIERHTDRRVGDSKKGRRQAGGVSSTNVHHGITY